jgi:hypothetical protein
MSTAIELTKIPKEKDYEDYLCAYLQAGGLYVERNIIHREDEELLELDILTTDFQQKSIENILVEIKSGKWGFSDIFKIRGWLTYLHYNKGCFIVQKSCQNFSYFERKARELDISLIDNSDLGKTNETLSPLFKMEPHEQDIETLRFSFLLERNQLAQLKKLKRDNPDIISYSCLDDYYYTIISGSFFTKDPIKRINKLFETYIEYKNITAKICHELKGGNFNDEGVTTISEDFYDKTFYKAENNILHVSLYIEHIARVTILKCAIEHLIDKLRGNYDALDISNILDYLTLPQTIKVGLIEITKDKYFHLYPRFWQFFTYVFGGFILTDIEETEYELLSNRTGIPTSEIPNAFSAFNKLFPREDGWFYKFPTSSIKWHTLFPIALCGIGANYRRLIYVGNKGYEDLYNMLSKDKTSNDLTKWNNLAHEILHQ